MRTNRTNHLTVKNPSGGYPLHWRWVTFTKLKSPMLYEVLRLRAEVCCEEQGYAFNDLDGRDKEALHLLGFDKRANAKPLIAYARLIFQNDQAKVIELSRVTVRHDKRSHGIGHQIMHQVIKKLDEDYPHYKAKLLVTAESALSSFYHQYGFVKTNLEALPGEYKNFSWPHHEMRRDAISAKLQHGSKGRLITEHLKRLHARVFQLFKKKTDPRSSEGIELKSISRLGN